ncbi:MAG: hypothetical protein WBG86_16400 [Polyangiales bacterium]
MEGAQKKLEFAEREFGPIVEAINAPDPEPGDLRSITPWDIGAGGMGRRLKPFAIAAKDGLREAKEAHAAAKQTFDEVSFKTSEALASQSVRYAVPPGRKLSTSSVTVLLQGDEVPAGTWPAEDMKRLVEEGQILEKRSGK